jgi:putative DNA methylase
LPRREAEPSRKIAPPRPEYAWVWYARCDDRGDQLADARSAEDFKGVMLGGEGFDVTQVRQVLFAIWKTLEKENPKLGVTALKTEYAADYWQRRQKLVALAEYIATKTAHTCPKESAAARELGEALNLDRV